jgi:hypothetical protein
MKYANITLNGIDVTNLRWSFDTYFIDSIDIYRPRFFQPSTRTSMSLINGDNTQEVENRQVEKCYVNRYGLENKSSLVTIIGEYNGKMFSDDSAVTTLNFDKYLSNQVQKQKFSENLSIASCVASAVLFATGFYIDKRDP